MGRHLPFQGVEAFPMGVVSRLAHCCRDALSQRGSSHLQFFSEPLELNFFFFKLTPNLCSHSLSICRIRAAFYYYL